MIKNISIIGAGSLTSSILSAMVNSSSEKEEEIPKFIEKKIKSA